MTMVHLTPADADDPSGPDLYAVARAGAEPRAPRSNLVLPRPMYFPSPGHMRERLDRVAEDGRDVEGLTKNTIARWRTTLRSFEQFLSADGFADRFCAGDIRVQVMILREYIASLRTRGVAPATVVAYWGSLESIFGRVSREDGVLNPLLEVPRPRAQLPQPRYLTRATVERIFVVLRHGEARSDLQRARDVAIVAVLLYAGLRRQEALNLHMGDVDLQRGTLLIRRGKARYGGRDRTAYLGAQGREALADYLRERRRANRSHPEVFTSVDGDTAMPLIALCRLFRRISAAVGERVTPHMLRHTCATLLREQGVDTRLLMDILGHRSLAMVTRYAHVYDGEQLAAVEKLRLHI